MSGVAVGFALQPEQRFLELTEPLLGHVDLLELAPETLWRLAPDEGTGAPRQWEPNGFFAAIAALARQHELPCVAHGVGLSVGSLALPAARRRAWHRAIAETQAVFGFRWYTDHLGATVLAGQELGLPLPVPWDARHERAVVAALDELARLVPLVGLENTVSYFALSEPLDEPAFLGRVLAAPNARLLLDLHNLFTVAGHEGFDPADWLDRAPLDKVIELHVSGGSLSRPGWLPDGRRLRLDSHDSAVPEAVFELLERVLPRCPRLAAVTLERMEGTVDEADVPVLADELARVGELVGRGRRASRGPSPSAAETSMRGADEGAARRGGEGGGVAEISGAADITASAGTFDSSDTSDEARELDPAAHAGADEDGDVGFERRLAAALRAGDPVAAVISMADDAGLAPEQRSAVSHARADGVHMAALLVARLRFERLVQGAPDGAAVFERAPREFTAQVKAYHRAVAPEHLDPASEWARFCTWRDARGPGDGDAASAAAGSDRARDTSDTNDAGHSGAPR